MKHGFRIALLGAAVCLTSPHDATADTDLAEYERLLAIQEAEYERLSKMREAAIDGIIGNSLSYPGKPNGWDDFSINPDMNDSPSCAYHHYDHQVDIARQNLEAARKIVRDLRNKPPTRRTPPATNTARTPPRATTTVAGPPPTARPPTPTATQPPGATATQPPSSPPKKDMNCLCRCSCAAAGFNVNNVRSYYSTSPVRHVNPNGEVSESCMQPSQGPCVCQGYVCRRAALVSSGACADGC